MKKILTYGTFDILHIGHINLLKRAKQLGDYLIVGVSTDEFNKIKGKESVFCYEDRKRIVESLQFVDEVIEEKNWNQKEEDIKKYKVNIFVMGNDWENKFDYLNDLCEVKYLPRTEGISTSKIKKLFNII